MAGPSAQLRAVGTAFLLKRPWIVAPGMVAGMTLLVLSGAPTEQLRALGPGLASMFVFFCVEAWIGRRRPVGPGWLAWSLRITVVGLTVAAGLTGGLRSPFLPLSFAPVVVAFAAFGRRRQSVVMVGWFAASIAVLALVPAGWPWPALPWAYAVAMTGVSAVVALALAYVGVAQLSDALVSSGERLLQTREEALVSTVERLRSLEGLGAKLAHELKNPLASIKGLAQLSVGDLDDARARKRFEVLLAAAEHMDTVLDDYLSFSRPLDALEPESLRLPGFLEDTAALARARAGAHDVSIDVTCGSLTVQADPRRLREALLNVLVNAIEASPRGGRIRVHGAAEGATVRIAVDDEGLGIPASAREKLGTPYFTTKERGTGLGVVIAMAALREHGGEVGFETPATGGTRVSLVLPATPPSGES